MNKQENDRQQIPQQEKLDSRVIPVMREAVASVHLVLYGVLKEKLADAYAGWSSEEYTRFVGCLVNDVFGTPAQDDRSRAFAREYIDQVELELRAMADRIPDLLPILTDALRMQTLCDHEEGINSLPTLLRARALGLLQEERTIPLPSTFMIAVRKLGAAHGLLQPMQSSEPPAE